MTRLSSIQCCDSPDSVPRKRRNVSGAYYVVTQCRSCGFWGSRGSSAVSHKDLHARGIREIEELHDFDEEAFERAQELAATQGLHEWRRHISTRGNPSFQERELRRLRDDLDRREAERAKRAPYYQSPEWKERREYVMRRANGVCEGCGRVKATEVHHMSYDNFANEFLWELKAVCTECHERFHAPQKARDEAIRRGEIPYEGPVGPVLQRIVDGIEEPSDEENEP